MIYKKDPKVKYWEMAKYIDDHIREENCDEQKIFEYMYQLFYVLSVKGKMFKCSADYDQYALYGATHLFVRYRKELTNPKLTPIKSSLNYIKTILYPTRVDYQQANFSERFTEQSLSEAPEQIRADAAARARQANDDLLAVDCQYYLTQIAATIRLVINTTPYKNDPVMCHRLRLSCMLTLLKSITPNERNKERLKARLARGLDTEKLAEQIYNQEALTSTVLFHLDSSLGNYVDTLVRRIKRELAKGLKYLIGSYELSDESIRDILASPMSSGGTVDNSRRNE